MTAPDPETTTAAASDSTLSSETSSAGPTAPEPSAPPGPAEEFTNAELGSHISDPAMAKGKRYALGSLCSVLLVALLYGVCYGLELLKSGAW